MQRVSAFLPSWEKRHSATNKNHNSLFGWSNRSSGLVKINTSPGAFQTNRVQRETFWPATLDVECDKAARILKSFCVDGFLASISSDDNDSPPSPSSMGPRTPVKIPKRIPKRIIQNAAGIAVFSCMRSGLWMTGSGGSGILIARKSDGTWSPPSGIMLHTPTLSFIIGVDIYDCVLVISNLAALEAVTRGRVSLGDEVELRSGQTVTLDSDESEVNWRELGDSVLTYMKARGQQQSVDLNGCILTERSNENERFYYSDVTQMEILSGSVAKEVEETTPLFEVIKMAEGRTDYDQSVIDKVATEPAPSDAIISTPKSSPVSGQRPFGIVKAGDPDPFGVLALEMAGLEIREAGSRIRPTSSMIDLKQTPLSPIFSKFSGRQSVDTLASRSHRGSIMSTRTARSQITDSGIQTDAGVTPETTPSPGLSDDGNGRASSVRIVEEAEEEEEDSDEEDDGEEFECITAEATPIRPISMARSAADRSSKSSAIVEEVSVERPRNSVGSHLEVKVADDCGPEDEDNTNDADDEDDVEDDEEEEPVVFEVAAVQPARTQAVASRVIQARGNVVGARSSLRLSTNEADLMNEQELASLEFAGSDSGEQTNTAETNDAEARIQVEEFAKESEVGPSRSAVSDTEEPKLEFRDEQPVDGEASVELHTVDDSLLNEPHLDTGDHSDSTSKKHTSSIYTGITEDRWSFDGSSVTTPTSERRFSISVDKPTDDTPKRPMKEIETLAARESFSSLHEMTMHSPIAATH
ncbi:SH3 domain-containing YSC84-like protein 1 [Cladobotryum mycophilum]|uniref:SH3 domain-containing YSC84-like protein 1 n=1 Tax=Cladobotryum mycophilum TaxID=491253 RepID=A0ABR0T207_9HYPO